MTGQSPGSVHTYGGWRRTRGMGLFGLDLPGTLALLACVVSLLLLTTMSLRVAAIAAAPVLGLMAVIVTQVRGTSVAQVATRRARWTWGQARGHTTYRAASAVGHPSAWNLPGVLAPTELVTAVAHGEEFGVVWNRRTGHLTATLQCAAASTWLVDGQEADGWVANWHAWLASLGYLPMVRSVAVTVETAPAPGTALRDAVQARIAPDAPGDTVALMRELAARSPAAAADVDTRVSITLDPAAAAHQLRTLAEACDEVSRVLTGLESSLNTCGVSVLARSRAAEIAGTVRTAFDPAARGDVQRILAANEPDADDLLLTWDAAGPVGADEYWDHYRHDSGISVTWGWQEAPRQQVTAGVLSRLLSPARYIKRVTMVYRPMPAGHAARMLESQVNAAAFRDAYRRAQRRDESARDLADRIQAQRAAAEEAQGAGVVLMSLYATVTVPDDEQLEEAVADLEARADQCKIRLRRLYGAQAAGFATTLPTGTTPGGRR